MSVAMAKKSGPKPKAPGDDGDGSETGSIRLFAEDVRQLNELSALRQDKSAAVTFRSLFGELLGTSLLEATERRSAELRRTRGT